MKVLFITPEIENGGIATYCSNLWPQLEKRGIEICVATTAPISREEIARFPFPLFSFNPKKQEENKTRFEPLRVFPLIKESLVAGWTLFQEVIDKIQPDLIEVTEFPLLFVPWIIGQSKVPVLVQLHGSLGQVEMHESRYGQCVQTALIRHIEDLSLRKAEGVAALSKANMVFWRESLGKEVFSLPPFYTLPSLKKLPRDLSGTAPAGVVLGRVQTWKGPEELCQAAEIFNDDCPKIEWIGGDNYYRDYSVSMSGYLRTKYPVWGTKIVHTGRIPYAEAHQKLAAAKFLLVPSLWDTFNFTVIEGMAQGKVVICSDGAGASEHIVDGENGFVYPAKDVKAFAEKIRQADQLPEEERDRIGENARETVERVFASEEPVKKRIELYQELIRKGPQKKDDPEFDWLREWLSPDEKKNPNFPEVLLDQLPLRRLGAYMANRIKKKFF